jgi:hypothetical protein
LSHSQEIGRVIVLLRGYINCPAQYHESGERFYDLGDNVPNIPLPHPRLTDRITDELTQPRVNELALSVDGVMELLMGLAIKLRS